MGIGVISYNTLNKDLAKALKTAAIPPEELPQVQEQMRQTVVQEKKYDRIGNITLGVFGAALIAFGIYESVKDGADTITIVKLVAALAVFIAALFPITAFLSTGLMVSQYNAALKKGYPDQADLYKL